MTLKRKLQLARIAAWCVCLVFGIGMVASSRAPLILGVPIVVVLFIALQKRVNMWYVRRTFAQLGRHAAAQDLGAARVTLGDLREVYRGQPATLEQLRVHEATLLTLQNEHAKAVRLLESIDRKLIGARWEPLLLNNLAWSVALTGEPARAVALARASLDASERLGGRALTSADLRACQLGTLGTALALSGEADEAVPFLEQALERGGNARQQSARAYHLGEALRALGKRDTANEAYARAMKESPDGEWGKKSAERLQDQTAYRT